MTESALFEIEDAAQRPQETITAVGGYVRLLSGALGRVVALSADGSRPGWVLVKLSAGRAVWCSPSSLS